MPRSSQPICKFLQVGPITYYAAKTRPPSARSGSDAVTTAAIAKVHAENYGVYGSRRSTPSCAGTATRSLGARGTG